LIEPFTLSKEYIEGKEATERFEKAMKMRVAKRYRDEFVVTGIEAQP
jgi:hypothetical protein